MTTFMHFLKWLCEAALMFSFYRKHGFDPCNFIYLDKCIKIRSKPSLGFVFSNNFSVVKNQDSKAGNQWLPK